MGKDIIETTGFIVELTPVELKAYHHAQAIVKWARFQRVLISLIVVIMAFAAVAVFAAIEHKQAYSLPLLGAVCIVEFFLILALFLVIVYMKPDKPTLH